jgi:muramoyltetrapeptide carboxypeptidase
MISIPPYLAPGDTIGVVCPAGFMPADKSATCIEVLQQWGYRVKVGKTVGHQFHYFSGTDAERIADLQEMLDDDSVKAILCARGGYGLSRIIDTLDFMQFERQPKWVIGFSDVTVLHAHIHEQLKIATLHAPMAGAFNEGGHENEFVQSLRTALAGQPGDYSCAVHPFNNIGTAKGQLIGGNLSLIAHLVGSRSSFNTRRKILFLEDIGEYIYNIDRMMIQLKRSGMLEGLAGLIIGGFTELKDTLFPFGQEVESILHDHVKNHDYPICFGFPVSHERANYALKEGLEHTLVVGHQKVNLAESTIIKSAI